MNTVTAETMIQDIRNGVNQLKLCGIVPTKIMLNRACLDILLPRSDIVKIQIDSPNPITIMGLRVEINDKLPPEEAIIQ